MGRFSDIIEFNRDQSGPSLPLTTNIRTPEKNPIYKCSVCSYMSFNVDDFHKHLQNHYSFSSFAIINDIVLRPISVFEIQNFDDIYFVERQVESIQLFVMGVQLVSIKLITPTREYKIENSKLHESKQLFDLTDKRLLFQTPGRYMIAIDTGTKIISFSFYVRELPEIDMREIDGLVQTMKNALVAGMPIDWPKFDRISETAEWNDLEQRYFNGFYEYYYACTNASDANSHFLTAYNLLKPFSVTSALVENTIRFISFRLNNFTTLEKMCERSNSLYFRDLVLFFKNADIKSIGNISDPEVINEIYIPEFDSNLIAKIQCFLCGHYDGMQDYITSLQNLRENGRLDQHTWDKVCLLAARFYLKTGVTGYSEAAYFYDQILSHYFLGEVERFRNGQTEG